MYLNCYSYLSIIVVFAVMWTDLLVNVVVLVSTVMLVLLLLNLHYSALY